MGFWLIAALAVAIGLLVGTFNSDRVLLDLVWVQLQWPLGLLILAAFAIGLLTGLSLLYFAQLLPLKLRIRRLQAGIAREENPEQPGPHD